MEDKKVDSAKPKQSKIKTFARNIRAEFRKIVWPSRQSLVKQTVTVSITSLGLGLVVFCYDSIFSALLRLIVG